MNPLEIMAFEDVRRASEQGCAVAALSAALDTVQWRNAAAEPLLSGSPAVIAPIMRRLRDLQPALARDGEVAARLSAPGDGGFTNMTVSLRLAETATGQAFALLTSLHPVLQSSGQAELAERLLRDADATEGPAAIVDGERVIACTRRLDPERAADFAYAARELLDGQLDYIEIEDEGERLAFARVADGLVLVSLLDAAATTVAETMPEPERAVPQAEAAPVNPPAIQAETSIAQPADTASPIGQIVQRWHERLSHRAETLRTKAAETREKLREGGTQTVAPPPEMLGDGDRRFAWRVDKDFRVTAITPELSAAVGATGDDLIGRSFFDLLTTLKLDPSGEIADLLRNRQMWSGRIVAWPIADTDEVASIELAALPVYGRGAVFEGVRGFGTIIDRQPRAQDNAAATGLGETEAEAFASIGAALRTEAPATESALPDDIAALLDSLPLAVLVQHRSRLVQINRNFSELSGYRDIAALEDAGGLEVLEADAGAADADRRYIRLRRADGSHVRVTCQMQRLTLGGMGLLLFTFQRPAPAPSDDEALELRAVLNTATDGILLLEADGTLRSMNGSAEALFGVSASQRQGFPFTDLLAEESRAIASDYLAMLRDGGFHGLLNDGREVMGKVARGKSIPLFITIGKLGAGRGWCVVIRDIGHWKRIEEDLVAARRQAEDASLHKSRFLTNISHELRTPLNAIIGFADVMATQSFGPIGNERYLQYLSDIKKSGHHLLDLVNDLLDLSKIEAGKATLNFEAVSIGAIVGEIVALMQPQANAARVILRSDLPRELPSVLADARSIRQIALNLLSNAIRYTQPGGQVVASTSIGASGELLLRFRDSGVGMSDEEIAEAMMPYQQVSAITRERGDGTGLGLPLTKAIVEANAAVFTLRSAPGEGTLAEIAFPPSRLLAK